MDPNVYLSYLCFLDNGSSINRLFKKRLDEKNPHSPFDLIYAIQSEIIKMSDMYPFIFEHRKKWEKFSPNDFFNFLKEHGSRK